MLCCALVLILGSFSVADEERQVLLDVRLRDNGKQLEFANDDLTLAFEKATGRWIEFRTKEIEENLLSPSSASIDVVVNGTRLLEKHGAKLERYDTAIAKDSRNASLRLHFLIDGPEGEGASDELICSYTLTPGDASLIRSATFTRRAGEGRLQSFIFTLPRVSVGATAQCTVAAPGPFWPNRWIAVGTKYEDLTKKQMGLHSAPDAGFGLIAITNPDRNVTLASFMSTAGEVAYHTNLRGDDDRLTITHSDQRACRLAPGTTVRSDEHHIVVTPGPLNAALAAHRAMATKTMPLPAKSPDWARQATILEVYPRYFPTGFKGITERLPFYRDIGFNVIYLMPHWVGGYSPIDLYAVDPRYGTKEDLQALVRKAHELGMKVLFDMVIHGFNEKSPVVQERPELFCRTESGEIARHPAWKSMTTDWGSPAYRKYMVDLVLHDLKTYDIDGYRVDAQTFKGANWDPDLPYPAYRGGSAAHELIADMRHAMRRHKPDVVMLSEVFGPLFYTVCDLVHDNQTEAPQYFIEQMDKGLATAAQYKAHMATVLDALPPGATRVYFARNHDTSWFYHFNGYTPRFLALDAIHVLFGIPEVFAGDPKHKPNPDDDPKTWEHYRRLFALRKQFPELARGDVLLNEVSCSNPQVFTGLRRLELSHVIALVSLSDKPERATVNYSELNHRPGSLTVLDPATGKTIDVQLAPGAAEGLPSSFTIELAPFQVLVGRVPAAQPAEATPAQ